MKITNILQLAGLATAFSLSSLVISSCGGSSGGGSSSGGSSESDTPTELLETEEREEVALDGLESEDIKVGGQFTADLGDGIATFRLKNLETVDSFGDNTIISGTGDYSIVFDNSTEILANGLNFEYSILDRRLSIYDGRSSDTVIAQEFNDLIENNSEVSMFAHIDDEVFEEVILDFSEAINNNTNLFIFGFDSADEFRVVREIVFTEDSFAIPRGPRFSDPVELNGRFIVVDEPSEIIAPEEAIVTYSAP